jgi:WD40 repeat protein
MHAGMHACTISIVLQGQIVGEEDFRIFSASQDNTLRLWDPVGLGCLRVYGGVPSEVSTCTFFEGWNLLVSGHDNGAIALWNVATGAHRTLHHHTNTVSCMEMALIVVRPPCCLLPFEATPSSLADT